MSLNDEKHTGGNTPPKVGGGIPWVGHMVQFALNPFNFVNNAAKTTGEIARFKMLGQDIILLTGDEASELFYRASDEQLDQAAAYKLMTPIFGEGVVFDATPQRKNEQLKMLMPSLRMDAMREHSSKIVLEVNDIISEWGEDGDIEIVDFMKRLTINTASHCLLGKEFRYELSDEFTQIYHDLEQGVSPIAYHLPYLPTPAFKRRDKARVRLQELVGDIVKKRESQKEKPSDMFQSLIDMEYKDGEKLSANEITGMLVAAVFAGHHTSSGTAAWVLIELLKAPELMRSAINELDDLLGEKGEVTFQSLREMPILESVLKEVLRLHPPLIILMRQVEEDLHFKQYTIKKGDMVWACPPVTHRLSNLFKDPEKFDPSRFSEPRCEDKNLMAYQPFGGGKHKCSGNAFALFQIKAIFAVLLRRYDFQLADGPDTYVDDYTQMIVQPKSPCNIRYRRRSSSTFSSEFGKSKQAEAASCPHAAKAAAAEKEKGLTVKVDQQLCQGHAMCVGESAEYFQLADDGTLNILKDVVHEKDKEAVANAVKFCPNQALTWVEE